MALDQAKLELFYLIIFQLYRSFPAKHGNQDPQFTPFRADLFDYPGKILKRAPDYPYRFTDTKVDFWPRLFNTHLP